jgi:predicted nuclease with TOPRIM domain
MFGCDNGIPVDEKTTLITEIQVLQDEIELLNKEHEVKDNELEALNSDLEKKNQKALEYKNSIANLEKQVAIARGYSIQFMYDIDTFYDSLDCPIYLIEDQKAKDVAVDLIQQLSINKLYSDKKVVRIELYKNDLEKQSKYTFMCLMFTPPSGSIRLYSITVDTSSDNFIYEIN